MDGINHPRPGGWQVLGRHSEETDGRFGSRTQGRGELQGSFRDLFLNWAPEKWQFHQMERERFWTKILNQAPFSPLLGIGMIGVELADLVG